MFSLLRRHFPALAVPPIPEAWLTPERIKDWGLVCITTYVLVAFAWISGTEDFIEPSGAPIGHDFLSFWSASLIALGGAAAAAYDPAQIAVAHKVVAPGMPGVLPWSYPPTYLLAVLPLALIPYLASFFLFIGLTFCAYAAVVYWIAPTALTLLMLIASPGAFLNTFHGQNGFLTGALLGAACYYMDKRPVRAGIAIGLLAYKPHWAILFPIALAADRRWRTFAAAAVTAVAFAGASLAVLGVEPWIAFLDNLPFIGMVVEQGKLPWPKMPTTFVTFRQLGVGIDLAHALQLCIAFAAAAAVAWTWSQPVPVGLKGAMVVVATTLATPYLFDYDLAALAIPLALLAREGMIRGFLPGERIALIVAWAIPLIGSHLAFKFGVQATPLVMAALIALMIRRARVHLGLPGLRPAPRYA
ncbi:MAG: glycosyltransferase family 87 protein [Rhodospirillales bacterium]